MSVIAPRRTICPAGRCTNRHGREYPMCFDCWQQVPRYLKAEVHRAREHRDQVLADPASTEDDRFYAMTDYRSAVDCAVRSAADSA